MCWFFGIFWNFESGFDKFGEYKNGEKLENQGSTEHNTELILLKSSRCMNRLDGCFPAIADLF